MINKQKTILVGLNEINFDYVNYYIKKGILPNFKKTFKLQEPIKTESEKEYKLLEPWIQWVTIHTGKTFNQHKVFRLGDIVNYPELSQLFEELENKGLKIGAISPFNTANRLKDPAYFVPDPWTKTNSHGNAVIKNLYKAINHSVNNNTESKFKLTSLIFLIIGFLAYVPLNRWQHYFKNFFLLSRPGIKALILDSLLADIHFSLWKTKKPDFSNLFLNSGAHIQHHYLFNSKAYKGNQKNPDWYCPKGYDPLAKILVEYDYQIGKLLKYSNLNLIIATGLHQQPHNKTTFYWRLKDHMKFCNDVGISNIVEVQPRMSRDFLINFDNEESAQNAEEKLNDIIMLKDLKKIFKTDNRGKSLFVELVYSDNILDEDSVFSKTFSIKINKFKNQVSFVAIKNGEHNGEGYLTSNFPIYKKSKIKLTELKSIIIKAALSKI